MQAVPRGYDPAKMRGPDYTLDLDRLRRVGFPEVVLAQGKTAAQIVGDLPRSSRAPTTCSSRA